MEVLSQEKINASKYVVKAKFTGEEFKSALTKAYNKQKPKIAMPGFRKGKVPQNIIEKQYGDDFFYDDALTLLFRETVNDIILETKLPVIDVENTVVDVPEDTEISQEEIVSKARTEGFVLRMDMLVKPEVDIADYKGIEIETPANEVSDEDVEEALKYRQKKAGRLVDAGDRPVQVGDVITLDFEGSIDGVPFQGGKAANYKLEVGSGSFIPGFEDQIIGKKKEEDFEVNVTFPDDYHADDLAGKPAVFACKVHDIQGKELPELDDEFAKDMSEFDTLEEYKADLHRQLQEEREEDKKNQVEQELSEILISKAEDVEIPALLLQRRRDSLIQEWINGNIQRGWRDFTLKS